MMDLVKKQLFYIICGVVAIAGIVLGVLGLGSTDEVDKRIGEATSLFNELQTLSRGEAINERAIQEEQKRVDRILSQHDELIEYFEGLAAREPLIPDLFPNPKDYRTRITFPVRYKEAFQQLAAKLNSGTPPTEADILVEKNLLEGRSASHDEFGMDDDERDAQRQEQEESDEELGDRHRSGLIRKNAAEKDPAVQAAMKRSGQIYCYLSPDAFDMDTNMLEIGGGVPPAPLACWYAQVSFWIQQDVVDSIARINDIVASSLKENEIKPCVRNLPIKDVLAIRVSNSGESGPYILQSTQSSGERTGSLGSFNPAGMERDIDVSLDPKVSFTNTVSGPDYEVVRFSVKLVIDSRDLPFILSEMTRGSLTALYHMSYEVVEPNLDMQGKIYGGEPVMYVVMDFETFMLSNLYIRMMPDTVLTVLGKQRPAPEQADVNQ